MILADIRPYVTLDAEESQLNEGGANQWDNCGAADYALILKWLGNGDPLEPQQIMDRIHGVGYHGGEVSSRLINFFSANRDKYPKLPQITVEQGGDVIARSLAALKQFFPITNWWWCNSNGDIQSRNTGILHWSGAVYVTDTAIGIFNIMRGQLIELSYAYARAAYAGEFTTFHASVKEAQAMTGEDLVRIWYWQAMGRDPKPDELQNWVSNLKPGAGPAMFAQLMATPEAKAYRQKWFPAAAPTLPDQITLTGGTLSIKKPALTIGEPAQPEE